MFTYLNLIFCRGASSLEANCISNEEYSNVTADCYDAFFQGKRGNFDSYFTVRAIEPLAILVYRGFQLV